MSNLISKEEAIKAIISESLKDGAYGYMDTKSIIDLLNDLTSTQPEIIYCKDCKHYALHSLFGRSFGLCERLCNESHTILTESNDFCSHAERRNQ